MQNPKDSLSYKRKEQKKDERQAILHKRKNELIITHDEDIMSGLSPYPPRCLSSDRCVQGEKIKSMEIAKGVKAEKYLNLDLSDYTSDNWNTAFEYLEKRLKERFIEPADKLIEIEKDLSAIDKKYGFAILALDCLLIETIQSFYEGVGDSTGKSKKLFKQFLEERTEFKEFFKTEPEREAFYKNFRCGILHQAQTGKDTKVWAVGSLVMQMGDFIVVNRQEFHKKIKLELDNYLKELRKKQDHKLMNNFKTKMDFISGK